MSRDDGSNHPPDENRGDKKTTESKALTPSTESGQMEHFEGFSHEPEDWKYQGGRENRVMEMQ